MRKFNSSLVNVVAAIVQDGTNSGCEQGTNLAVASKASKRCQTCNLLNYSHSIFLFCHNGSADPSLVMNIVLIAHATPLGCSQIHASNVLEEPQDPGCVGRIDHRQSPPPAATIDRVEHPGTKLGG